MNVQCKWKGSGTKPSLNVAKTAVVQDQEKNKHVIKLKTTDGTTTGTWPSGKILTWPLDSYIVTCMSGTRLISTQ